MEARAETTYSARPDALLRDEYNSAAAQLTAVLEQLEATGGRDRATARRIADMHREYLQVAARRFAAIDRGAGAGTQVADARHTARLYDEVRSAVDSAAAVHRQEATGSLQELRESSRFVARWVPIMGSVGMVLVVFFCAIMFWYRRLVQQSTAREIARLEAAAFLDNLTGLHNHRALHETLPVVAAQAHAAGEALALMAVDLDGLKLVNDTRGHHQGDELIRRLADGLRATMPEGGTAFRIGGDEFVVLLEGNAAVDAYHYSQDLQAHLNPPVTGIHARIVEEVTLVTVGVTDLAAANGRPDLLLQRADLALLEAKKLGHRGLIWAAGMEAIAVDSGQTIDQRRFLATALAKAVDAKDSYTRSHCETVAQLCVLIAEQLGLDGDETERLRLAGLMHDVGKIGVPDSILQKPDRLTDEEFEQMRSHSTLGASIVAAAQLTEESTWVRHHHERVDGMGYPDGLAGDEIPLQSRIIFVADAFEAITSDRPYRLGRPASEALEELERCAGTQFDPACVAALQQALQHAGPNAVVPASVALARSRRALELDTAASTDTEERRAA